MGSHRWCIAYFNSRRFSRWYCIDIERRSFVIPCQKYADLMLIPYIIYANIIDMQAEIKRQYHFGMEFRTSENHAFRPTYLIVTFMSRFIMYYRVLSNWLSLLIVSYCVFVFVLSSKYPFLNPYRYRYHFPLCIIHFSYLNPYSDWNEQFSTKWHKLIHVIVVNYIIELFICIVNWFKWGAKSKEKKIVCQKCPNYTKFHWYLQLHSNASQAPKRNWSFLKWN